MELTYSDYLQLESLLKSQKPRSVVHEEMFFIITHQVYELWFKQVLYELDSILAILKGKELGDAEISLVVARLHRITEIQRLLIDQITVLETMSPMDFLEFRDRIAPASGFQSVQFRLIESKLGLKNRKQHQEIPLLARLGKTEQDLIQAAEREVSIQELVDRWLSRTPFLKSQEFKFWDAYRAAVEKNLAAEEKQKEIARLKSTRDGFEAMFDKKRYEALVEKGERELSFEAMQAALLIFLYREQPVFQLPYRLLSQLIDVDELLTGWRSRHAQLVFRFIGTKIGTGGSSGFDYLRETVQAHRVFRDLSSLSSFLIPRSSLPKLPEEFQKQLGFTYKA